MTVADGTTEEIRTTGAIPGPRTEPTGDLVWLGLQPGRRTPPRTEYWDVRTARWVTRPPVPGPRRG